MTQNITLAWDKQLPKQARVFAAQRGSSVSALLVEKLRNLVERESTYESDRRKALAFMENPISLGGKRPAAREELHDRKGLRWPNRTVQTNC